MPRNEKRVRVRALQRCRDLGYRGLIDQVTAAQQRGGIGEPLCLCTPVAHRAEALDALAPEAQALLVGTAATFERPAALRVGAATQLVELAAACQRRAARGIGARR